MATNLALDDDLIIEAQKVGHHKTKKEAVMAALKEYIAKKSNKKLLSCLGQSISTKIMITKKRENDESHCRYMCLVIFFAP